MTDTITVTSASRFSYWYGYRASEMPATNSGKSSRSLKQLASIYDSIKHENPAADLYFAVYNKGRRVQFDLGARRGIHDAMDQIQILGYTTLRVI